MVDAEFCAKYQLVLTHEPQISYSHAVVAPLAARDLAAPIIGDGTSWEYIGCYMYVSKPPFWVPGTQKRNKREREVKANLPYLQNIVILAAQSAML